MELFFAHSVDGGLCRLDAEESGHCVRVLRHRAGDEIAVIDGIGTLYRCRLVDDSPKGATAQILSSEPGFGAHAYHLTIACCPTKNNERFEWFVEKATEIGVDRIVPVIGDRSERKVYKTERAARIALSATKQSLKARIPEIAEPLSVRDFITAESLSGRGLRNPCRLQRLRTGDEVQWSTSDFDGLCPKGGGSNPLKLIAYCFEDESHPRISIKAALDKCYSASSCHSERSEGICSPSFHDSSVESFPEIIVLIGPEGDFSPEEAALALEAGFIPVHLGASRLRTETAAITAAEAVYLHFI